MNFVLKRALFGVLAFALVTALALSFERPQIAHAAGTVATPSSPASTVASFTTIGSGLSISGFSTSIRVILSTSAAGGELKLATATGLTTVSGYDNSTSLTNAGNEIAFEGSQTDANTALAGLQYKGATAGTDTISIEVLDAGISSVVLSGVYHYYGISSGETTYTYPAAKTGAATSRTINGTSVTPWLATVGSAAENLAISAYVNANAWIGAEVTGTVGTTRTWSWVTSNDADGLSGVAFATDSWGGGCRSPGGATALSSRYQNWDTPEPNNCVDETAAYMYASFKNSDGSTWNDFAPTRTHKYIWEYASATSLSLRASFTTAVSASGGGGDPGTTSIVPSGEPSIGLDFSGGPGTPTESARANLLGLDSPEGSSARLTLYQPELQLLDEAVSGRSWNKVVTLPSGLGAGQYTLVYTVTLPGGEVLALHRVITIDASGTLASIGENVVGLGPASALADPNLASTGVRSSSLPWWALLFISLGLVLVLYSLRARRIVELAEATAFGGRTPWEILSTPIRVPGFDYIPGHGEAGESVSLSEAMQELDVAFSRIIVSGLDSLQARLAAR